MFQSILILCSAISNYFDFETVLLLTLHPYFNTSSTRCAKDYCKYRVDFLDEFFFLSIPHMGDRHITALLDQTNVLRRGCFPDQG